MSIWEIKVRQNALMVIFIYPQTYLPEIDDSWTTKND